MLFKNKHLDGIKSGTVSLAFRKWDVARVKKDSLLKTAIGLIQVKDVSIVAIEQIKKTHAIAAGYHSLEALIKELTTGRNTEGNIYKIKVAYYSEDPRIQLWNDTALSEERFQEFKHKLAQLEKHNNLPAGWALNVIKVIAANPDMRAADLVPIIGEEKDRLKLLIRKIKNIGLTISKSPGYEVSEAGKIFLKRLKKDKT